MSLLSVERKTMILEALNHAGKVRTNDLVTQLSVSSETIRRYLEELEADNLLKRVYGGAVKLNLEWEELPHMKREVLRADEKKRIGRLAASLVQDHDVIAIDDGSTSLQMIHYLLYKKDLTIVTNSVPGLNLLIDYQNKELFTGNIYFIGGRVDSKHSRISGSVAEKLMDSFFVNKAFITIDGMLLDQGITSYDADRAILASKFMKNSKQNFVLTDYSKIGNSTLFRISELTQVDTVICDKAAPVEWKSQLTRLDVEWLVAE
ncbi:DeoR/GlpR family DNA-binding transcription regulator [Paenibacillus segetis]|uniref:DeoR family transcriptional regulator n=1 Tax=Paenibacillus segetis TaxID=1325360 RepID=A0ABQ1YG15_9BACL|nr:DeoR/GlpR family DNA-binding transcription regulator [Paenibacillus segetis]GGH23043.1 DeoR family transcriptional regulator [Paenibacillus segetis]